MGVGGKKGGEGACYIRPLLSRSNSSSREAREKKKNRQVGGRKKGKKRGAYPRAAIGCCTFSLNAGGNDAEK